MPALGGRTARAAARAKERTAYLERDVLVRITKAQGRRQARILKTHPHIFFGIDKDLFELAMVKDTPYSELLDAAHKCSKTTIRNLPCEHVHAGLTHRIRADGRILLKIWLCSVYKAPNFVCNPCWDADGVVWATPVALSKDISGTIARAAIIAFNVLADKRVTANADARDDGAGSGAAEGDEEGAQS